MFTTLGIYVWFIFLFNLYISYKNNQFRIYNCDTTYRCGVNSQNFQVPAGTEFDTNSQKLVQNGLGNCPI